MVVQYRLPHSSSHDVIGITQRYSLIALWIKCYSLFAIYKNITCISKHMKIFKVGLPPPYLIISDKDTLMNCDSVVNMTSNIHCFIQEMTWQVFRMDHNSHHFLQGMVLPFNNFILLRCDRGIRFMSNPFSNA